MTSFLIIAGDPSGDLHAANLVRAIKARDPRTRVAAVGGTLLREAADEFLHDLAGEGVSGFWEPVRKIPALLRLLKDLRLFMRERRPSAVICVDFYGFNRRVLEAAKKEGLKTYYYVSPQVWASRPGRIHAIKRFVDRMLVIFPFEEDLYRKAGVPADFVGHPLLDDLPQARPPETGRTENGRAKPIEVGLLPGSRPSELRRHMDLMLEAWDMIRAELPAARARVFAAPSLPDSAYAPAVRRGMEMVRESDYVARSSLDLAIVSSGTATLENALLGVPMVVVYRLSWPTYFIARGLIRVPYISMANLLAGRKLVPELIQSEATPERVSRAALDILRDEKGRLALREQLASLRSKLGEPGAAKRTADIILKDIKDSPRQSALVSEDR